MEYLKEHLKFLIDEFINAYENERFEDAIRLRRQIANITILVLSSQKKMELRDLYKHSKM
jgi:alanine racemase